VLSLANAHQLHTKAFEERAAVGSYKLLVHFFSARPAIDWDLSYSVRLIVFCHV
jgi:hypothetical protein